jgi:hypothetical protein
MTLSSQPFYVLIEARVISPRHVIAKVSDSAYKNSFARVIDSVLPLNTSLRTTTLKISNVQLVKKSDDSPNCILQVVLLAGEEVLRHLESSILHNTLPLSSVDWKRLGGQNAKCYVDNSPLGSHGYEITNAPEQFSPTDMAMALKEQQFEVLKVQPVPNKHFSRLAQTGHFRVVIQSRAAKLPSTIRLMSAPGASEVELVVRETSFDHSIIRHLPGNSMEWLAPRARTPAPAPGGATAAPPGGPANAPPSGQQPQQQPQQQPHQPGLPQQQQQQQQQPQQLHVQQHINLTPQHAWQALQASNQIQPNPTSQSKTPTPDTPHQPQPPKVTPAAAVTSPNLQQPQPAATPATATSTAKKKKTPTTWFPMRLIKERAGV